MKSAGKARNNGLYRHIRTSKEIIRNLLNDYITNQIVGEAFSKYYHETKGNFVFEGLICFGIHLHIIELPT